MIAGTVLHGTRVGLRIWLLAFFFVGRHKKGISALQFECDTGLGSYQTAWMLMHKVRSALKPKDLGSSPLGTPKSPRPPPSLGPKRVESLP